MAQGKNKTRNPRTGKSPNRKNWQDSAIDKAEMKGARYALETGAKKDNDPAWYAKNASLLRDAASLPFSNMLGRPISVYPKYSGSYDALDHIPVGGVMVLKMVPSIGIADSPTSPINVAMNALYSYVRHANSGHSNYDYPDLGMYMIGLDSAYSYYSFLVRLYGCMSLFSIYNKYYPQTIVECMGVNYGDIAANLADFRLYINQYQARLATMCIPKDITFITRHIWAYENLYQDANSVKAQTYLYTPEAFYVYSETGAQGSQCTLTQFYPTQAGTDKLLTFKQLRAFGDSLLNPIIGSEDLNIMSGDIMKAFGTGGLFKTAPIAETYTVKPVYSQEVLSQIENAFVYGPNAKFTGIITQALGINEGYIENELQVYQFPTPDFTPGGETEAQTAWMAVQINNPILNMHKADVTPADVMVATRLLTVGVGGKGTGDMDASGRAPYTLPPHGSDILAGAKIAYNTPTSITAQYRNFSTYNLHTMINGTLSPSGLVSILSTYTMLSAFDWAPKVFPFIYSEEATKEYFGPTFPFMDFDNYTTVDAVTLENLHSVALMSQFACSTMGSFNPIGG